MDTLFFITAKLVSALIRVDTWIVLILGLIVLALVLERRRLALRLAALHEGADAVDDLAGPVSLARGLVERGDEVGLDEVAALPARAGP